MTMSSDSAIGSGRVAVVTGAASGIGCALAQAFAGAGSAVVVADLDGADAKLVAADIRAAGGEAEAVEVDVANAGEQRGGVRDHRDVVGGAGCRAGGRPQDA